MHPLNLLDLAGLLAMPWRSAEALRRTQEQKLRRIVRHAAANVPFYRETWAAAGVDVREIRTVADLGKLPIVSKRQLQEAPFEQRLAHGVDRAACHAETTSGSTGAPLEVLLARGDQTVLNLAWVRAFLAAGLRPWQRRAVFTPRRNLVRRPSWYERLGLMRRLEVSTWSLPEAWIADIRAFRPHAVMGYVKALGVLVDELERREEVGIRPRVVFSTSELLDDASRARLAATFGCRVFDIYASSEAGCMAWECPPCGGYHVSADTVLVEVLQGDGPAAAGEDGEVVVTNLHNRAMPFIRYRQGDVVTVSRRPPACGRSFPLIEGIRGREDDCVVLPSGRTITYSPFYYSIQFAAGIRRWRVIQDTAATLRVELETGSGFERRSLDLIRRNLEGLVGSELAVDVAVVDSLVGDPRRKFRSVSSMVRRDRPGR